jgi:predicted NBD/HSP70 family sugar kinase/biotin operon repressor
MQTGSKQLMRDMNTTLVVRSILKAGEISRADISKELGLTKATISAIVQTLLDRGIVLETGPAEALKGRKPILLTLNRNCGYIISINIDFMSISVLVADITGGSCAVRLFPNTYNEKQIVPAMKKLIRGLMAEQPESLFGMIGIVFGINGVTHNGQIVFTPYYHYASIDFVGIFRKAFNVPVILENESNLSAIGEHTYCYPTRDIISISVHTGIGLGLILNGHLYTGHSGYAGEFGHTIVHPDGRPCPCGNSGCIEQYASELAILRETAARMKKDSVSANEFAKLYAEGNPIAVDEMNVFIRYMGIGINNIMNSFNPEIIVINSSFTMNCPDVITAIEGELKNRMRHTCTIAASTLQDMAILLGGVVLARNQFLGI